MTALVTGCGGLTIVDLGHDPDRYELIDDMEHSNELLPHIGGRTGFWAVYNDGTPGATQWPHRGGPFAMSPLSPPRGVSHFAAHTYGSGFSDPKSTGWAQISVALVSPDAVDGGPPVYDASHYRGVRFWIRSGSETALDPIRFTIDDLQTDPLGGQCSMDVDCYNRFGTNVFLSTEWSQQKIMFADLQQNMSGWGKKFPDIDIHHVFSLSFNFIGPDPFDLWIDDIEFVVGDYVPR